MPIITHFGKILALDVDKNFIQVDIAEIKNSFYVKENVVSDYLIINDTTVFSLEKHGKKFAIKKGEFYFSADPDGKKISADRLEASDWELFTIIPEFQSEYNLSKYFTDLYLEEYKFSYISDPLKNLNNICKIFQEEEYPIYHKNILKRGQLPEPGETLIHINCNLSEMFEKDWMKELMPFVYDLPHADISNSTRKNIVVVDSYIRGEKVNLYRNLFYRENNIFLIHLSDETFMDNLNIYKYCNIVWRNLFNPLLNNQKNLTFFPLGYKEGFASKMISKCHEERKYLWFFAGDIKKSSRAEMFENMKKVSNGFYHLTTYFDSKDSLSSKEYREIMSMSTFIPCPAGFVHLDSFRIYEALEAGCIPIIENGRGIDFFSSWMGKGPVPMIERWADAPALINQIVSTGSTERIRMECQNWWNEKKRLFRKKADADLEMFPSVIPYWREN